MSDLVGNPEDGFSRDEAHLPAVVRFGINWYCSQSNKNDYKKSINALQSNYININIKHLCMRTCQTEKRPEDSLQGFRPGIN